MIKNISEVGKFRRNIELRIELRWLVQGFCTLTTKPLLLGKFYLFGREEL